MAFTIPTIAELIASITGVTQSRITTEALNNINILAMRYFQAEHLLRAADAKLKPYAAALIPHRLRCGAAIDSIDEILAHQQEQCDNVAQEGIEALVGAARDIKRAMATIDDRLRPLQKAVHEAQTLKDRNLTLLLQHLEVSTNLNYEVVPNLSEARITPDMYPPEDLDLIERQVADVSTRLAEQARSQASPDSGEWNAWVPDFLRNSDPLFCGEWNCDTSDVHMEEYEQRSFVGNSDLPELIIDPEWTPSVVEIRMEVEEKCRQQHAFLKLKKKLAELSLDDQTFEEAANKLAVLRSQAFDLAHWLAIRGMPVKDGSFVSPPTDDDEDSDYWFYSDPDRPTQEIPEDVEDVVMSDQRGLFDNVDVEKPVANNGGGEEMVWTEEDYQAHVARCDVRVMRWLDEMPNEADSSLPSEVVSHAEGLEELPEVGLYDSISCIAPARPLARRRQFELEIRRGAWVVELEYEGLVTAQRIREESPWIVLPPGITGSSESGSAHCT